MAYVSGAPQGERRGRVVWQSPTDFSVESERRPSIVFAAPAKGPSCCASLVSAWGPRNIRGPRLAPETRTHCLVGPCLYRTLDKVPVIHTGPL